MNRSLLTSFLVLLGLAAVAAYLTLFTVHQTQQALVLEFGKPKRLVTEPGLNYKIPFIQNVEFFDKRLLDLDTGQQEVIAADQERLVVDAFARWRITDPLLFYQAVGDERGARLRLGAFLEASLRRVLGAASFEAVVRDKRHVLMQDITRQVNTEAKGLGITVADVRIKRADLPEANSQAIYRRMQTERQRQAAEIRAQGEEASRRIRGTADREVTVLKAEATGQSSRIRGEGDGQKNRIFAEAFGQDPDFFSFYRSMQAYEGALKANDTRLLLSPNSEFFQYFGGPTGWKGQGSNPNPNPPQATPSEPQSGAPADQDQGETEQGATTGDGGETQNDAANSNNESAPEAPPIP